MSWLVFLGEKNDFESRVQAFTRVFDVPGVPELQIQALSVPEGPRAILWSWKKDDFPDSYFVKDKEGNALLFSGVLIGLGSYGPLPEGQKQAVARLFDLIKRDGEKVLAQLNGSFSLLYYDSRNKQTSVFTDRFASRSVWFSQEDDILILGDYPSAVASVKRNGLKLNPSGLWSLFHTSRQPGTEGLFSGIRTLKAGQKAVISGELGIEINNWWERRYKPDNRKSPREWGNEIAKALEASAEKYKRVCESPHVFLSGGLDSRIAAAALDGSAKAVTICSAPNAESRIAGYVAGSLGMEHEVIIRSPYWYLDTLEASALISSGNYFKNHAHFMAPVQAVCSEKPTAEFFLGDLIENFNKHYFSMPEEGLAFSPDNIYDILYNVVPYTNKEQGRVGVLFNQNIKDRAMDEYKDSLREYARYVEGVSDDHSDRLDTFLRWADVSVTPTYNMITCIRPLARERNLFFDNDINDLSLEIPAHVREGVIHKWILYHMSKRLLLIPDANTFLLPIFNGRMASLTKKVRPFIGRMRRKLSGVGSKNPVLKTAGSWLLTHEMYRKDDRYRKRIGDLLENDGIFRPEIFDLKGIENTWKSFLSGNIDLMFEIEALFTFGCLMEKLPYEGIDI
jgi:hypothetical protein